MLFNQLQLLRYRPVFYRSDLHFRFLWTISLFAAKTLLNPLETIKKVIQVNQCDSFLEAARTIYKQNGIGGFFRGILYSLPEVLLIGFGTYLIEKSIRPYFYQFFTYELYSDD